MQIILLPLQGVGGWGVFG